MKRLDAYFARRKSFSWLELSGFFCPAILRLGFIPFDNPPPTVSNCPTAAHSASSNPAAPSPASPERNKNDPLPSSDLLTQANEPQPFCPSPATSTHTRIVSPVLSHTCKRSRPPRRELQPSVI
ncbi:hypothetical protein KFK09_008392 [Dendrobium nobile]|uniref:Uncharacterized protein n=1 Tax=Dendrobium nobile TaxID=94219 RepID=A0A8T3BMZ5_DENNO|nr:hypothetical protein KFK09_008392 [Dendrobium nobile]